MSLKSPSESALHRRTNGSRRVVEYEKKNNQTIVPGKNQYQELVNNLSVGVYRNTAGPKGHFIEANPAMVRMLEADSKEQLLKHNVSDFYKDPAKRKSLVAKITSRGYVKNEQLELVTLRGNKLIGSVTVTRTKNRAGDIYFDGIVEDVTEQKRSEEILRKNELQERLQETFDNMIEGCQIISFDFRYLYVNKAVLKQGRKPKEAILGHPMKAVYPGIEKTKMFTYLKRCMKNRAPYNLELENEFKLTDGSKGWLELRMEPVPEGVLIFSDNINKRKGIEDAINVRNKKLEELSKTQEDTKKALLNVMEDLEKAKEETDLEKAKDDAILFSITDGIVATDLAGRIISFNQGAKRLLGIKDKVIGRKFSEILQIEDEKGRSINENDQPLARVLASKKPSDTTTYYYVKTNGDKFPVTISISGIVSGGKLAGAVEVFHDNTQEVKRLVTLEQQMQDLKKFQMAVANTSDQIVISDAEGTVLYANRATEKTTGYSVAEIIGTKAGSLWGGHRDKNYDQKLWKTIKADKQTFMAQTENRRKNGEPYSAEIHVSPVLDEHGNPLYFVAIERDITREKEIDKAKSEFVSLASHQLRTPLGVAKWYLEAIKGGDFLSKESSTTKDYFEQIYKSNERVLSLVRDLLSVSRIDQGRVKDNPAPTNITELIQDIYREMSLVARQKNIKLESIFATKTIPPVYIDALRLREVLENLVTNGIEYTPPGGTVKITVNQKTNQLRLSVSDTGIGISDKDKAKLFTKFFRSEQAIASNTDGSGLGLYVVKSYVEGWGGKISIDSQEGLGSIFTITLPINFKVRRI